MNDLPLQIGETIQTASINRAPSPHHDLNPSTAASRKQPVRFSSASSSDDIDGLSDDDDDDDGEIPLSALRPQPRKAQLPPLPDLRFEQSYLASIKDAEGWARITYITVRDQVFMPLVQGVVWTLMLSGWRHWNSSTAFNGRSVGARVRRWWWGVNNWELPDEAGAGLKSEKLAAEVQDYYHAQFSNSGID
ncbi:hypothetical protein B0A49_01944 [Cryomyces minteri]|uniref:DUF1770-domain-containing protein n=1 Tax=Cryomyces minteri TaxID=331657 RepID=A0A4U0XT21_9PEZI|nr:hypothetical protein B0A49_01721 [Cryomyces minteri]TKA78838.1 hypothetical protein B0A49_01944 [Cryomyces minteri]